MNPTIPPITASLGRSVIYEEYKGDFARARVIAEDTLNNTRQSKDPAALADALLARGVVHLLQGEPSAAIRYFEELEQLVPSDANRRLRAISFSNLAMYWRYNLFPDGNGASATELQMRWNSEAYAQSQALRKEAIFSQATDIGVRFESSFVHQFLSNLQPSRSFVQASRNHATGTMTDQLLQAALQGPNGFRREVEAYGADQALLAYADLSAADLCQRAGNLELAEQFLHRAIAIYQQNSDSGGAAACQMMWADWLAAPFTTPRVWNFAIQESSSSRSDLAWTLEADEWSHVGANLSKARQMYDEAKEMFQMAGAPRGLANIELRYGYLGALEGNYTSAIDHAREAGRAFADCGDRLGYWLAETHRVLSRIGAGQYPEEGSVAETLGRWGTSEGSFSYALGLGLMIGRVGRHWLVRKGDYERALACYRMAALLYKALGATTNFAKSLVDQGAVYQALGERKTALTLYEQALDAYREDIIARPVGAPERQFHGIMLANDVFHLFQEEMNADGMERSAERLQVLLTQLNRSSSAQLDEADPLAVAIYALSNLARSTIEQVTVMAPLYRAVTARDRGEDAEAKRLFAEARGAAQATDEAQRDWLEAVVLGQQREYGQAAEVFRRYMTKGGTNAGFVGALAGVMKDFGGEQGQQEVLRQKERANDQAFTFFVRIRAYGEAKEYFDELVRVAGEDWLRRDAQPWLALSNCAEMYEGLGEWKTALDYYDRAINELEARRNQLSRDELRTALVAGKGPQYLYFQAARAALTLAKQVEDRGQTELYTVRAFNYAERGKARALLDLMAGSVALAQSSAAESQSMRAWREANAQLTLWRGLLAQERNKQQPDQDRIAALSQRIDRQHSETASIESRLARSNPNFYQALNTQAQVISAEQARAILPRDTALLQYAFLGDHFLAWAMTAEGMITTPMAEVNAKALDRQIKAFHGACRERREAESLGSPLAKTFLEPLTEVIQAYTHLIIVPYGAAHALPFHALPWMGEPLGASRVLSYLPSASTLQFVHTRDTKKSFDRILAIGSPKDMAYQHPLTNETVTARDLPAAAVEAAFVASLFPNGKALIGEQATEEIVRSLLTDYPLLHFATHGILSEEAPLLSAILLANGEALKVYELMGLQLRADLAVLSACSTGLGEITGGDDVIGLTRGLLGAGALAAVVSLWPVNDLSTSLLMGEFYRQLRAERSTTVALHAAQNYLRKLEPHQIRAEVSRIQDEGYSRALTKESEATVSITSEDYSHPHFWAPFILIG